MNEPTQGPRVRWRSRGHELQPDTDVLRFEVADLNRVITSAVVGGRGRSPGAIGEEDD